MFREPKMSAGTPVKLLIANRAEIAIRVARAAAELGWSTVAVYAADDAASLHVSIADEQVALPGRGVAAYLDGAAIIAAAHATGCGAIHPGYGFLAENAGFAQACADAGLIFVGPDPEQIALFGEKAKSRAYAQSLDVAVVPGTTPGLDEQAAAAFLGSLDGGAMMVKAVAGGGGRGMRAVRSAGEVAEAVARCRSEALGAFADGTLFAERLIERARHIEVQVIGDGTGAVAHLGERDCTLQRRNQKLIEFAPSPNLDPAVREALCAAAVRIAAACRYRGLGTIEFLLDADRPDEWFFMEVNPRVQVEHTVTEAVTGVDLVQAQLRIAAGATLAELGLEQADIPRPRGFAVQLRINAETMDASGTTRPSVGAIASYQPASGPGVRVDGYGYAGYGVQASYDTLLAKLIVSVQAGGPAGYRALLAKAERAAAETRIDGIETNLPLLRALLADQAVQTDAVTTGFVEANVAGLIARAGSFASALPGNDAAAVASERPAIAAPPGTAPVLAPTVGIVVSIIAEGAAVRRGDQLVVLEAMKMEHPLLAPADGHVRAVVGQVGDSVSENAPLLFIEPADLGAADDTEAVETDLDYVGKALAESSERHAINMDAARPEAVKRRHDKGKRTARENIADLLDDGSFVEFAPLALAAQRRRRTMEELIRMSPADGLVAGIGSVNGQHFTGRPAQAVVMSYDYTVFAGTQGGMNHKKMDRLLGVARDLRVPVVAFCEGGGGRPGETDKMRVAGLEETSFTEFARLSGKVPLVGITSGRCFAGNAALLGCCDVIIATADSTIGMGGPAMIEGGGLGVFSPEEVGPMSVQVPNGVVDVAVADEAEAVDVARRYLSYFQGSLADWSVADQRHLRHIIPENRLRVYDVRRVIELLCDEGSMLELRPHFGTALITVLVRIEGQPVGLIANDPRVLSGALDSDASDKGARFLQMCDVHGLPVLSLCDTPGFMVGPEHEKTAAVRHVSRLFLAGANMAEPMMTVVLRKAYGLGAMAMSGGSSLQTLFTVSWPQGEFGGMGLEGSVRLGYKQELAAVDDPAEREVLFRSMVDELYEKGKAINAASYCEIDDVIDPADTRRWIATMLRARPPRERRADRYLDAW
jgi:acetyl/propionyl-CoA carboxylase alpha subunit/acetyl-CoA carboxylase carboxyltransferase component